MNVTRLIECVDQAWRDQILPTLIDYIRIPNLSPAFDCAWTEHGHMDDAVALFEGWARQDLVQIPGAHLEIRRLEGRTPVLYIDIPGTDSGTALLYGHLDKQPEMERWHEDQGPWTPVVRDERLYGRGGDGYAMFAALTAVAALKEQDLAHPRCITLIEASEESSSRDLPFHIEALAGEIGTPDLVICLDSGCGDYDRLWLTSSLRGLVGGMLSVSVMSVGVHSGDASGIVPSPLRILRQLLSRLEDEASLAIKPLAFQADIPLARIEQARGAAEVLGDSIWSKFPLVEGMAPVSADLAELALNRTWRAQLSVTGLDGFPPTQGAGAVALPIAAARLSLRLLQNLPSGPALDALKV